MTTQGWLRCGDREGRPGREARLPRMGLWRVRERRGWVREELGGTLYDR